MKFRARARAIERRREPQPWLPWLLLMALALGVAMFSLVQLSGVARSQPQGAEAQTKEAPGHGDVQTQPPAAGVTKATPGLLKPKTNPDPAMALPTPNPKEFPTPVIKPPGTAGNPSTVVPR